MTQFDRTDDRGTKTITSAADVIIEADTDQNGAGDFIVRTGLVERARITAAGVASGLFGTGSTLAQLLASSTDAGAHKITNLAEPGSAQDAATKHYADSLVPTLSSLLATSTDAGAHLITNLSTPGSSGDAATKGYVDGKTFTAGNSYRVFNVEDATYGAVADAFYQDGVATSASTTFTSATATFSAADNGKTIVILRAGASSEQDLHTTITYVNPTTVTLANAALRSQSGARFYVSRSGTQTAAIQSAIDACAAVGGGTVLCPGVGYLVGTLVLKNRVWIRGVGMAATMLHQVASTNGPVIRNDVTSNNSAFFCGVLDMRVDGNRARQSDITTTLTAGYTANSSTTLALTSAAGFLPAGGMVTVGTNKLYYTSISGNTLNGVSGGYEASTDANASIGATVTQHAACGIYFSCDPFTSFGTTTEAFDPHQLVQNVFIKNVKGDGLQAHGQSENRWHNVWVQYCDEIGFRPSFDSFISNCTADKTGRHGFYLRSSESKLSVCKSFYAGNVIATEGHGFFIEGPSNAEEGTKILGSCGAQDCQGAGLFTLNAQRVIAHFTASSNSRVGVGTWAGIHLTSTGSPGTSLCVIEAVCVERNANGNNQTSALFMDAPCNANKIRLTHGAASGATVGAPIKSGSDLTGGNDISINGQGGVKSPAFSATPTFDPYVATTYFPGVLTANVTAVTIGSAHYGATLKIVWQQNGVGGFTVAVPANVKNAPSLAAGANAYTVWNLTFDGTNWIGG